MIFSSSTCPLPGLVYWCRTLKYSLGAGLDPVKCFRQLGKSGPRAMRGVAREVAGRLAGGSSLADAFAPHAGRFPPLFLELVAVGEQSGRLEDAFAELEEYYENALGVQRDFRAQLAYPAVQVVAAVLIVSGLILVLGMLGRPSDVLGVGAGGTAGALAFLAVAFGLMGGVLLLFKLSADSVRLRARLEALLLWVPAWGGAMRLFAVQRFCVALRMTHEAGLRNDQALHYSFRATANAAFQKGEPRAAAVAKKGGELADALRASGAPFPAEFVEAVEVAEVSGQVSEVLARLADRYREDAARAMKQAARYTGWAAYATVALLIIAAIFRIAGVAFGTLSQATRGL